MRTYDNCFDFLRFLFASIVMIGHLIVITGLPQLQGLYPYFDTYISITGFFVISGFLITQSYMRSQSVSSYFLKRAKRLLPAYVLVVVVCAAGLAGLSAYSPAEYYTDPGLYRYLIANLSFLNFVHPCLPGVFESDVFDCSVNPALWTLKVEVMFYCCVPIIVWLLRKMRRRWILLAIIYALSVLYRNGLHWYADHTQQHLFVVLARQLPGFMSYFATGMALFLYKDKFLQWKSKLALPALCVAVVEYLLECEWLFPLAFGIVVLWCAYSLPQLNNFARFGDISYGVYIYHAPIIKILYTIGFFAAMNVWLASGLFVCMVLTVSLLSWHLMEKRILQRR